VRRRFRLLAALTLPAVSLAGCGDRGDAPDSPPVGVRAGIDHAEWSRLLQTYVDPQGLVAYEHWKANADDVRALDAYLARIAAPARPAAAGDDQAASLINAYNALTIRWILRHYPTESIRSLEDPFARRRDTVGGRRVSLDDLEHATLRPLFGYRVHGALVCAARSCPPLRREAYTAARLDGQLDRAMREWLDRGDLNRFDVSARTVEISPIFKWFAEDFERAGGLRSVLKKHARGDVPRLLDDDAVDVGFRSYDWGLNDKGGAGSAYGGSRAFRDRIRRLFD